MDVVYLNRNQIPLLKTEPLHIVFRSKASVGQVTPGYYDWATATSTLQPTPNGLVTGDPRADLDPANLYAIEHFTFSADIDEADFSGAIIDQTAAPNVGPGIPRFHLYVNSETTGPILRQPIPLAQYYQNSSFAKWRAYTKEVSDFANQTVIAALGIKSTNQFQAAFEARLQQTVPLIGKGTITLILALGLLEIRDENFIRQYKAAVERKF